MKVGAQFALELDLPSGERVFIPEVEVLYNRPARGKKPGGFGARFIDPPAAAAEKLRRVTSAWSGTERPRRKEQRGGAAATVEANESTLLYAESRIPDPVTDEAIVTDPCRAPVELAASMQIELSSLGFGSVRPAPLPPKENALSLKSAGPIDPVSASIKPTEAIRSDISARTDGAERVTDPELVVELAPISPDAALKAALFDEPKSLTPAPEVVISRGPEPAGRLDIHAALSRRPGASMRPSRRPSSGGSMKPSRRPSAIEAAPSLISLVPEPIEIPESAIVLPPSRFMEGVEAVLGVGREIGHYLRTHKTAVVLTAALSASLGLVLTSRDTIETAPLELEPTVAASVPAQPLVLAPKSDVAPPAIAPETSARETPRPAEVKPPLESSARLVVPTNAKVIRTLMLSNPPRYVIDLEASPSSVSSGPVSGRVLGVRVGKHDGFTRVVFDVEGSVGAPKIERSEGSLKLSLD